VMPAQSGGARFTITLPVAPEPQRAPQSDE
jgi:hypothetical protein